MLSSGCRAWRSGRASGQHSPWWLRTRSTRASVTSLFRWRMPARTSGGRSPPAGRHRFAHGGTQCARLRGRPRPSHHCGGGALGFAGPGPNHSGYRCLRPRRTSGVSDADIKARLAAAILPMTPPPPLPQGGRDLLVRIRQPGPDGGRQHRGRCPIWVRRSLGGEQVTDRRSVGGRRRNRAGRRRCDAARDPVRWLQPGKPTMAAVVP